MHQRLTLKTCITAPLFALALILVAGAAHAEPDPEAGKRIAVKFCARCHVVGESNRLGGINSTPSFYLFARKPSYLDRVANFYERRPHPVFVRVPGVERWSDAPAYTSEFTITTAEIENIVAYIKTLKDKQPKRSKRRRR